MKIIIIFGLVVVLLVGLVQSASYDRISNSTRVHTISYYSDLDEKTVKYNLEGTKRFDDCKRDNGLLYKNGVLSFNCTDYTTHEDYIQFKINERENPVVQPVDNIGTCDHTELETRVTALETFINTINDLITDILARLGIIEKDIEAGYTGTCPNGVIIKKGIVTGCV